MSQNLATVSKFNLVSLNKYTPNDAITKYFNKLNNDKRGNTVLAYKIHFKEFIMYACGKGINSVSWEDVLSINYSTCESFRDILYNEKHMACSTVNSKIASVKTLFKVLHKHNKDIDVSVATDVEPIKEFDKDKKDKAYGSLTYEEVHALYEFCLKEDFKPLVKKLFFETAIVTGNRKECLLNLTWKDVYQDKDNSGNTFWIIYVYDKGKEVKKPISDDFYTSLCTLKGENTSPEDSVFDICDKILARTLTAYCTAVDIDQKGRNIVMHSLKKASLDMVWDATRDINQTALQGSHKSIQTPYNNYLNMNKNYSENPSFYLFSEDFNTKELEKYRNESNNELLDAIYTLPHYMIKEIMNKVGK